MHCLAPFMFHLAMISLLQVALLSNAMSEDGHPVKFPSTGTLNLILANKNGFVIAADSRQTNIHLRTYSDDSQKLFRIGPRSAMVIAGFASSLGHGSLLDIQVASVLREKFLDAEWVSGRRPVADLPADIGTDIGYQLGLLGGLFATSTPALSPTSLIFRFSAAEITSSGKIQIVEGVFNPKAERFGPSELLVPSYEITTNSTIVDNFVAKSVGQDKVARAILASNFQTEDRRILDYYDARSARRLDEFSLFALEELAVAILEETNRATLFVGGPHQIGVFDVKAGNTKWRLPPLATDRQKLYSTILKIGFTYTPNGLTSEEYLAARGKRMISSMSLSLYQPLEQPLIQVFVGNWFRDVAVAIDGNVFAGNRFKQVRFKYRGGPFYFVNNSVDDCILETATEIDVPPQFRSCKHEQQASVATAGTIGSPIRPQVTGCVKRDADGKSVIKTDGWENGKNCKNSWLVVPRILP